MVEKSKDLSEKCSYFSKPEKNPRMFKNYQELTRMDGQVELGAYEDPPEDSSAAKGREAKKGLF